MEGQSPPTLQAENITRDQSLASTLEQSLHTKPPQAKQQSPLEVDACDMVETQAEEGTSGTHDESVSTREWCDRPEDELPDYNEKVYWEPDSDSEGGGDTKTLSSTTAKIVRNAFCRSLKPEKRKDIKRKQPIPDTPFTKVPKLDPTIQSRMSAPAKLTDRGLSGMQGYVLDAAVPLVNILESARNRTLTAKDAAESAQQALKLIGNASAHLSAE